MFTIITGGILLLGALVALALFQRKRKSQKPEVPRTYSGAIRATSRDGRNMKIVLHDDGSFAMEEEEPPSR